MPMKFTKIAGKTKRAVETVPIEQNKKGIVILGKLMVQGFESWKTKILQSCNISFLKVLVPFTFLTVHPQDIFNLAHTDI